MKIRKRQRRGYVKEADDYSEWTEFQVVEGRKILARFDMLHQAVRFVEDQQQAADDIADKETP